MSSRNTARCNETACAGAVAQGTEAGGVAQTGVHRSEVFSRDHCIDISSSAENKSNKDLQVRHNVQLTVCAQLFCHALLWHLTGCMRALASKNLSISKLQFLKGHVNSVGHARKTTVKICCSRNISTSFR